MRFFLKKNRMMLINATNLDRKSGGAKWRDDKGRVVAYLESCDRDVWSSGGTVV
jgi:hypothetical protein